ncbi:uncharacterized protein LOC113351684 [Papaver somniferum]|uniref:uncharacterized protein LOC113351684 n=1 Tax=Papaver somniferum TaxID=3469 RepID=UPI000E6FE652|nr:uncharacterized protein LOC113351684 [Papaver somniferum]
MVSTIHTIKDDQGNWLENRDQVAELLSKHFKKIYTSSNPSKYDIDEALRFVYPIITNDINASLIAIPSVQEIIDTVNMMAPWSSTGPDDFPPGFFRDNWDIVHSESTFVVSRQIHDNIVITHEILHSFKRKKKSTKNGHIAIKLDLSKAFDRLEWSFILDVFKKLGFLEEWYDCMLFCKAFIAYAKNILKVINVFAKASGQAINLEESGFVFSGKMHHRHIKLLSKTLHMKFLCNSEKYLGTPLFIGKDKTKSFGFLIDNFYARLNSSRKSKLNLAGRTVVTKHMLSSLSIYHMACFPFPKTVTSEIDAIQGTFWWSKKNPKHAAYFRSWGDIGKSKANVGLGIRNSHAINRVFICKLGWRLLNLSNTLIWNVDLLHALFLPDEVDRIRSIPLNFNHSDSFMWAHTKSGKFTIKSAYRIYINEDYSFWRKVWNIDCLPKIKFFMWKIFAHMLPVNSLMQLYNPNVNTSCPLCQSHDETIMHLFINCPVVSLIWFGLSFHHLISVDVEWLDDLFLLWHDSSPSSSPYNVSWPNIGYVVLWSIWKLRCDVLFRIVAFDLNNTNLDIKRMLNSYISPKSGSSSSTTPDSCSVRTLLSDVDHILFVDGSFKDFKLGSGVIWCDLSGNVICSRADFEWIPYAVGAEAAALLLAISWAEEMNLPKVVFLSDCLQLVNFVNAATSNFNWRSIDLLNRCRISIVSNVSFKLLYVNGVIIL